MHNVCYNDGHRGASYGAWCSCMLQGFRHLRPGLRIDKRDVNIITGIEDRASTRQGEFHNEM